MRKQNMMNMRMRFGLFLLMLFSSTIIFAQISITGTVFDKNKEAIIGGNILEKGAVNGTITNFEGAFSIKVKDAKKAVLVISYIGYEPQEIALNGRTRIDVILKEDRTELNEVVVVAYGSQKKETLTGAITSVKTDELLRSPNSSVANSLAGKVTGLSSVQASGQPGKEDPKIFVRGVGSLTEGASSPLILVDGVENSFFQMDPNEIESVSVLKDASATAVFGVRGANGVILVTTRRGEVGKARIQVNSSVGIQQPTRMLDMADSYTYVTAHNRMADNDNKPSHSFSDYAVERFRLKDEPIMYPDIDWRKELMNESSIQTQHNMNISGGTENVRYFVSLGFLFQDGLFKQLDGLDYDNNYKYKRYNYRTNLDLNLTKTTLLKLGIGGILGDRKEPGKTDTDLWKQLNWSAPMASPGIIDGKYIKVDPTRYPGVLMDNAVLNTLYGTGYNTEMSNNMNMDITLTQKLDFITKGFSAEIKGSYNTAYSFTKSRNGTAEKYIPYYESELDGTGIGLTFDDPNFNKDVVYRIEDEFSPLGYDESNSRGRNWYMEGSLRYSRKFANHTFGGLLLFNQTKKYYPTLYSSIASGYAGIAGRATYDYKSKYMAEFNIGYNGSENFPIEKRYGIFPAGSVGYIITEEPFMKSQNVVNYLKLRASVGLVGNDNLGGNRFMYLPDSYSSNLTDTDAWTANKYGYNFGYNSTTLINGSTEMKLGNPDVTWEKSLKQNYGVDAYFLNNRLKFTGDYFTELRKDILINRNTVPLLSGVTKDILPAVNMGEVSNHGFEIEVKWNDKIGKDINYFVNANVSYSKNKIIFKDEVEPNFEYMRETGHSVGSYFGYKADGLYQASDFNADGTLIAGSVDPGVPNVYPGDVKYLDLNDDDIITSDDQTMIAGSSRPLYTYGLNLGADYKGFFVSTNWTAVTGRTIMLEGIFNNPFDGGTRSLLQFQADESWTNETAATATMPRMSQNSSAWNRRSSTMWVRDGSYIKLKNLTVGYNITNKRILKPIGATAMSIKLTGYNLLTFDKFKIMDPESNPTLADTYPVVKIYNIGINVSF